MKSRLKLLGLVAVPALLAAAVPTAYAVGTLSRTQPARPSPEMS